MKQWQRELRRLQDETLTDDDDSVIGRLACRTERIISEDYTQAIVRDSNGITICVSVGKEPLVPFLKRQQ